MKVSYLTATGGRSTAYLDAGAEDTPQGVTVHGEDKHTGRPVDVYPLADDWIEADPT